MIFKIAVTGSTNKNHVSWAQLSIVYINNTACTLCFFSSQEKLGSHGFRQLSCVSRTAATWASGSADHYQHQHLALLSFFQAELNFLLFPETGNAMCTSVEFGIKYFWNQLLFLQDVLEWWFILWVLPLGILPCEFLWNLQGLLLYRATCSALQMLSLASRGSLQPHSVPNPTRLEPLCENPRSYSITPSHVPAHSSVHWACPDPQRSSAGSSLPGLPRWRKLSPTTTTIPNLNVTSLTLQRSHLPHPTELRCSQLWAWALTQTHSTNC